MKDASQSQPKHSVYFVFVKTRIFFLIIFPYVNVVYITLFTFGDL